MQDSKADEVECQGAVSLPVVEVEFKSPDRYIIFICWLFSFVLL